jgi:hypothetical protein
MQFQFDGREREVLTGLLTVVKTSAKKSNNTEVLKQVKRITRQLADNSIFTNLKPVDVTNIIEICNYVVEDASDVDENGRRGLSEEDEQTVRSIITKIETRKADIEV